MTSAIARFWTKPGRRPANAAKKSRRARLDIEALEDRQVPTVAFNPHFGAESIAAGSTNDGMQHPPVYLIFSGSYWTTSAGQQAEAGLISSTKAILNSPYLSGLKQYGSDGTATFAGSWYDSATVPSQPSTTAVQNFLQTSISNHNAAPGLNDWQHAPIYVVVSDPASSAQYNGGWNAGGIYQQSILFFNIPENIHMVWVGTSSQGTGIWTDAYTMTLSHEFAETISDPDSNGIRINPSPNLPAQFTGPNQSQIGDYEPEDGFRHYGYRLNGALVQAYWSNQDGAFIVPDGNSEKFYLDPLWNGSSFTGQYNLTLRGDQLGTNYNDSIRVDNAFGSVSAKMNNQSATFESGQIQNVYIDTRGGSNYVQIAGVPSGVSVNVDSSGLGSSDVVFVGSDNASLALVQGTVNVANSSGTTHLLVDGYADGARNIAVTDHSVAFSGLTTVNYSGGGYWNPGAPLHGVTALDIVDGVGTNYVDFLSVPSLTSVTLWADTLDVVYGPAANQVNVQRTHT
jgi:hypothetical protein